MPQNYYINKIDFYLPKNIEKNINVLKFAKRKKHEVNNIINKIGIKERRIANKNEFTNDEITKFINENSENLKEKSINLRYSKITPNELIGISEYNQEYFDKIDEIENQISNGENFNNLLNKNKLKSTDISNLSIMEIKQFYYNYDINL